MAPTLADRFRRLATVSQDMRAPFYAVLLRGLADDWDHGGPVRGILAGWEEAPEEAVVHLRLLAGLYRVVLRGEAPSLAPYYRAIGGTADPGDAWPVAREVVVAHADELRAALDIAPQTNEVGRAAALLVALLDAVSRTRLRRVRLLEVGASAGLNLRVDRFRITGEGWACGPLESPVLLAEAVHGPVRPVPFEIVGRRGCDVAPVDPTTPEGRLRLTSFVWPDHVERHARLAGALRTAADVSVPVDQAAALPWLRGQLRPAAAPTVLTVVWHSVVWLYLDPDERAAVDAEIEAAGRRGPVAHLAMEHGPRGIGDLPEVSVTLHPEGRRRRLGTAHHHGVPVRLDRGVRVG